MKPVFGAALAVLLAACSPPAALDVAAFHAHAAASQENAAAEWAGTYRGDLPCMFCGSQQVCAAPCGGVDTELRLYADGRYRLTETYRFQLSQPPVRREVSGRWAWLAEETGQFRLDEAAGQRLYRFEENRIRSADESGFFWGDAMFELMKTDE